MSMPISEAYNEDCFLTLNRVPDKGVNLFLQDTPFGVTQNKWDVKPDLKKMWPEWLRCGTDNAAYIFFATQPFACDLIMSNLPMFRYDIIWYKPLGSGFLNANKMPLRNHESIIVFYNQLPVYNPQMGIGKRKTGRRKQDRTGSNYGNFKTQIVSDLYDDKGSRHPQSVVEFTNGDRTKEADHPTQKPVDLIRYLIKTYSNPGDTVFDGYLGSFTTKVAAYLENRNFIGAEMDESYYTKGMKRFSEDIMQQQLF